MATLRVRMEIAVLLALLLPACQTTPRFEREFGVSVRTMMASQVANPAAAANANPVAGIDGHAGRAAQESYERSFTQPQANTPPLISTVGGGK